MFRPDRSWDNKLDHSATSRKNGNLLLNSSTSIFCNDKDFLKTPLSQLIKDALADTNENRNRIIARQKYFKYWFGGIDGYEEYKMWIKILKTHFNYDTSKLEDLQMSFNK